MLKMTSGRVPFCDSGQHDSKPARFSFEDHKPLGLSLSGASYTISN